MRTARVVLIATLTTMTATPAVAGLKNGYDVFITDNMAMGSLGTVRNSADNTQHIGCTDFGNAAVCSATNTAGVSATCVTSDPAHLGLIRGLSDSANLTFYYDSSTGDCTALKASNSSELEPKQP